MIKKLIAIAKKNWVWIATTLIVLVVLILLRPSRDFEEGCSTCSVGGAGVLLGTPKYYPDFEMEGCSTCSVGGAGVLPGTQNYYPDLEDEMYNMPDGYYDDALEVADTTDDVSGDPDDFTAVVEDSESDVNAQSPDTDTMIADYYGKYSRPYVEESDQQLVSDFYGDSEDDIGLELLNMDDDGSYGEYTLL